MKALLLSVTAVILSGSCVWAQSKMQVSDVLEMVQGGLTEDIVIVKLRKEKVAFDLSPQEMVQLKKAGVSDNIIKLMLDPSAAVSAPAPAAVAPPPAAAAPAAATGPVPVNEVGVYFKKAGAWTDLPPEIVVFKTGGVLKTVGTAGIVKRDVNGHINGENSSTNLKTPVTLLVYAPEGTAIAEYQLLRLREQKDSREFRTMTGGVLHASGGATRDQLPFEGKKVAPRTWEIELPNIGSGNYGLLPPASGDATGSSGRTGKVYSFRVVE